MLMVIPWSLSTPVKAAPVYCNPWSVLKIPGFEYRLRARSRLHTQKLSSRVTDPSQDIT